MRQILHIFRKDLRHFWPEASISILVTCAFTILYPAQWLTPEVGSSGFMSLLAGEGSRKTFAGLLTGLVPVSWFVLIVRLVQDECLVGQRPYWFTRPYEWQKLLAAKVLFLGLFLYTPFIIAQLALLNIAGFHPTQLLFRLLFNLLLNTGIFILPTMCLAALTRNFLRASLTLLAFFAVIGGFAAAVSSLPSTSIPYDDDVSLPMVIAISVAVLIAQYSSRHTWLSRSILITGIVTATIVSINPLEPYLLEHTYYPLVDGTHSLPITLALANDPDRKPTVSNEDKTHVNLVLPLDIGGIPYGFFIEPDDTRLRITTAEGFAWVSPWRVIYNHRYLAGTRFGTVGVVVDRSVITKLGGKPVDLELSLALTEYESGPSKRLAVPSSGEFLIPELGVCAVQTASASKNGGLHCRYPFSQSAREVLTGFVTDQPCPQSGAAPCNQLPPHGYARR